MTRYVAHAPTANASGYLQQLCKHWSHRFEVEFDPDHGRIPFDAETVCLLEAKPESLDMTLEGADAERAERLCDVVTEHLKRFAFREDFEVSWSLDPSA